MVAPASKDSFSSSLIPPRKDTESPKRSTAWRISGASPRPAIRKRAPGKRSRTPAMAPAKMLRPLRGSSRRPRNTMTGRSSVATHCSRGCAVRNEAVSTPFGMMTASPPWCSISVRRASSDTAMRTPMLSMYRRMGAEAIARETDRPRAAWNVPTRGAVESIAAAIDTEGTTGSWTCTTSKSFTASQRRVRASAFGFTEILATDPLKGIDTDEPADVIHSGRSSEVDGVST